MILSETLVRRPVAAVFDRRGGGTLSVVSDAQSVSLIADNAVPTALPIASDQTAGVMTAADKQRVDQILDSELRLRVISDMYTLHVPAHIKRILTSGFWSEGDGGAGTFLRADIEPTHWAKVPTADGAWWELQPELAGYNLLSFGVDGEGVYDSTGLFQLAIDTAVSEKQNLFCRKATIRAEGLSLVSGDPENLSIELNGSILRQLTPGATVLTIRGRNFELRNFEIETHDGQPSSDVLINQLTCFRCRFVNVTLGTEGQLGVWRLGSNGLGGNYWCTYVKCHTYWVLDPTIVPGHSTQSSSINANSWHDSIVQGVEIVAPVISPGNQQQFYGNTWYNCDILGSIINNYTTGIGPGTGSDYEPMFVDCTYEPFKDGGDLVHGPARFSARRIATFSDRIPFDPNFPDRRLRVDSSIGPGHGDYEPEGAQALYRADAGEGVVPSWLGSEFNGTWSVVEDAAENAPCGKRFFRWQKSASGQGSPSIVVPREAVRQAAYAGGLTVSVWCKVVAGDDLGPVSGYKLPSSASGRTVIASATLARPGDGWVLRWSSVRIEQALRDTQDDMEIMLSGINLGIAAEYCFGTIEVALGRVARPPVTSEPERLARDIMVPASLAAWTTAFTVTPPTRGTAGFRFSAEVTQTYGRATASMLSADILVARYDGTVSASAAAPLITTTNNSGALAGVRAFVVGSTVEIQVQLSDWSGQPTFDVRTMLMGLYNSDALRLAD